MRTSLIWSCLLLASSFSCARNVRSGGAEPRVELSDGQVLGALGALDTGEVKIAETAAPKLTTEPAKQFAEHMVKQHSESMMKGEEIARSHGIAPTPSALSRAVEAAGEQTVNQLQAAGTNADQAYLESQAKMHREALVLLDCVLVPSTQNEELKDFVAGKVRPTVQHHFEQASEHAKGSVATGAVNCSATCQPDAAGELSEPLRKAVCSR